MAYRSVCSEPVKGSSVTVLRALCHSVCDEWVCVTLTSLLTFLQAGGAGKGVLTCTSIVTMIQNPCQWNPELRGVGKDCEEKTAKIR